MKTTIKLCGPGDMYIFQNLWPFYQHEFTEHTGEAPNQHGVYNDDEDVTSLIQNGESLANWTKEPGALFPYLILADGKPAGFNLVTTAARASKEIDADFVVHEFFVVHAYRGKGVAEQGAALAYANHRGKWEIVTPPTNARGIRFWRRSILAYTSDNFEEAELDHTWGRRTVFTFTN
jgi:aminoglycoside 6'-N-acetyltransferase I